MSIYDVNKLSDLLSANTYPGRGIVIGMSSDNKSAAFAYFIMGRSENSRNRIFCKKGDDVIIYPFDESRVEDPSLIIYSPVRRLGNKWIVTNGDQTDTVYEGLKAGMSFDAALESRCFEPDKPNYTPRISGIIELKDGAFDYKLSILKSADAEGSACNRYTFSYSPLAGLGHFIHTYNSDGNPIPTFTGEPERVAVAKNMEDFAEEIWNSLNATNKVSMYACFIDLETGSVKSRLYNKNEK